MPGPTPKNPKTRQRMNRTSTAAKLTDTSSRPLNPALPKRAKDERPWHEETVEFWELVWSSPMAPEYTDADVPGMVALTKLIDRFNYGEIQLAAEIRLQRQCYGLTPLDRRRLQWEIERTTSAQERAKRRGSTPTKRPRRDPRKALRLVK